MEQQIKRPKLSQHVIKKAALHCSINITENEGNVWALAEAIEKSYPAENHPVDGYKIARFLENNFIWGSINAQMVEELDAVSSYVDEEYIKVCKAWVKQNRIQPPYPVGTEIIEGTITGISESLPATYEVKPYGQNDQISPKIRRLVRFENAHLFKRMTSAMSEQMNEKLEIKTTTELKKEGSNAATH